MNRSLQLLRWPGILFVLLSANYLIVARTHSVKFYCLFSIAIILTLVLLERNFRAAQNSSSESASVDLRLDRQDWINLLCALWVVFGLRLIYITFNHHSYDYWRHYLLIRNIQTGLGFSGYAHQPYVYFAPLWFHLASYLPSPDPRILSVALATMTTIPIYWVTRHWFGKHAAITAAFLWGCLGITIRLSSTSGGEALGIFLIMTGWLLFLTQKRWAGLVGSFLFGLSVLARPEEIFLFPVVLFYMRKRLLDSVVFFLPLIWLWSRNHSIILQHAFLFTSDAVATRSDHYNWLSTLFPPFHPDARAAWRGHYASPFSQIPCWWDVSMLFLIAGVIFSRKRSLYLFTYPLLLYLITPALNYLKYLHPILPIWISGFSASVCKLNRYVRFTLLTLLLISSATQIGFLKDGDIRFINQNPLRQIELEAPRYLVNAGECLPDKIQYLRPDKMFLGLPARPEDVIKIMDLYQTDWIIIRRGSRWPIFPETIHFISHSPLFVKVREIPSLPSPLETLEFYKRVNKTHL